jgi:hypothetical protein
MLIPASIRRIEACSLCVNLTVTAAKVRTKTNLEEKSLKAAPELSGNSFSP